MKILSIIGNVGSEPRQTTTGLIVVPVAVDNGKKQDGTKNDPIWVNVVGLPKNVLPYITKGTKLYVSGHMTSKIYMQNNNTPILDLSIYCNSLELISGTRKEDGEQ